MGLSRIVAVTRPEHTPSRHVLEKLGMRYERDVDVFGIHAALYALTRGESAPPASGPRLHSGPVVNRLLRETSMNARSHSERRSVTR